MINSSGVCCRQSSVSRLVVMKLNSQYRCRLIRRTPCASSPVVDGSVLIVAVEECIVVVPVESLLLARYWGWAVLQYCCIIGAEWPNLPRVCACSGGFLACVESWRNS